MKIAYVHVLPLEYYPPATTTLDLLARERGWQVSAWSSSNARGMRDWSSPHVRVSRPPYPASNASLANRIAGYLRWHFHVAREIAAHKPDVVISVEPHSALAVWAYYNIFGGRARLFIHHHEYYAQEDFAGEGMRLLRSTRRLERGDLFARAEWISETNEHRLRLLREWNPGITDEVARVFPNYPADDWVRRARHVPLSNDGKPVRFLYLGSASIADTFITEAVEWIASHESEATLHVVGNNIAPNVWQMIETADAANITTNKSGWDYNELPDKLTAFDVGLVLYRGNTQNFVYNVSNKAIEYLAAGMEVWYPQQMKAMGDFHRAHPDLRLKEVNFENLSPGMPTISIRKNRVEAFPFTAESAIAPLIAAITAKA